MKPGEPQDIDDFLREMEAQQAPAPNAAPMPEQPQTAGAVSGQIQQAPQPAPSPSMPQLPRGELVKPTGYMESLSRGGVQGATFGFADEARAAIATGVEALRRQLGEGLGSQVALQFAAQLAGPLAPLAQQELAQESLRAQAMAPKTQDLSLAQIREQRLQEERFLNEQARLSNPKTYLGGQVAGGIAATTAATAATGGAATPFLSGLGGSVAMGGLQGLGESEADLTKGEFGKALEDTGKGMAFGAAGYGVAKAIPVVAKKTGDVLKQVTQKVGLDKAATQAGQMLDDAFKKFAEMRAVKATGAIGTELKNYSGARQQEIGRTLLEEGVIPWSGSKETLKEAAEAMKTRATDIMDKVYGAASKLGKATGQELDYRPVIERITKEFESLDPTAQRVVQTQFEQTIDDLTKAAERGLGFDKAVFQKASLVKKVKAFEGTDTLNKDFGRTIEDAFDSEILGQADALFKKFAPKEYANRVPEIIDGLMKSRRMYDAYLLAEKGVKRAEMQQGNNLFGLSELLMGGVPAATGAVFGGAGQAGAMGLTGLGLGVGTKLAKERGSAVLARGAEAIRKGVPRAAQAVTSTASKLNQAVQKNPGAFGRFAQPLMQALQTSPQSLAVTDYTLANQSPEYRELRDALLEQEQNEKAPAGMSLKELLDMEGAQ